VIRLLTDLHDKKAEDQSSAMLDTFFNMYKPESDQSDAKNKNKEEDGEKEAKIEVLKKKKEDLAKKKEELKDRKHKKNEKMFGNTEIEKGEDLKKKGEAVKGLSEAEHDKHHKEEMDKFDKKRKEKQEKIKKGAINSIKDDHKTEATRLNTYEDLKNLFNNKASSKC
jgi:hypothetical protein